MVERRNRGNSAAVAESLLNLWASKRCRRPWSPQICSPSSPFQRFPRPAGSPAGLRVAPYLRHVCGSRMDCGCCLCGPAWKIAASLPGSSLGCREASAAQLREQGGQPGATSRRRIQWSRRCSGRARAGGLELAQECGPASAFTLLLRNRRHCSCVSGLEHR